MAKGKKARHKARGVKIAISPKAAQVVAGSEEKVLGQTLLSGSRGNRRRDRKVVSQEGTCVDDGESRRRASEVVTAQGVAAGGALRSAPHQGQKNNRLEGLLEQQIWSSRDGLDGEVVASLRRLRVGGDVAVPSPTPLEEEARASALQRLRKMFLALSKRHGMQRVHVTACFEKWHLSWLQEAGASAIAAGRLAPAEPLLPRLVAIRGNERLAADALERLQAMLLEDLVGRGLKEAQAEEMVAELRTATVSAAAALRKTLSKQRIQQQQRPSGGQAVRVSAVAASAPNGGRDTRVLVVQHGSTVLRLNCAHYNKLRRTFVGEAAGGEDEEQAFHRALFCMLLRYKALFGGGTQAALGGEVFAALRDSFDCRFECFASPLNCRYRHFCSAFPDTDEAFGSLGSFFAFAPESGSYQLNPPFVDSLVLAMASRLEELLGRAETRGAALTFVIVVGANGASRQRKVFKRLGSSRFFRSELLVKSKEHGYFEGEQHNSKETTRVSPCDSGVFVWQTTRAVTDLPASASAMQHVREGFRSSRPRGQSQLGKKKEHETPEESAGQQGAKTKRKRKSDQQGTSKTSKRKSDQ